MKIDFTKEEAQGLINLLDLTVKSGGLPVAEQALFFVKKIEKPFLEVEVKKK